MRRLTAMFVIAALSLCVVAFAAAGDQMLENPGFEDGPWAQSPAWHGEMTVVEEPVLSGEKAGKLAAGPEGDAVAYTGYLPASPGLNYRFTIYVRGTGRVVLRSTLVRDHPEDKYIIERPEGPVELTDAWQEIGIDISPRDPLVSRIGIVVELEGEGAVVYLDDALLTPMGLPGGELIVEPGYVMVAPGESADLRISARCDEGAITEGMLNVKLAFGEQIEHIEVPITGETTTLLISPPEGAEVGLATVSVVNAAIGGGASAYVDLVDTEMYAQFETLAEAVQINTPAHLLYLGDSLTDQRRDYNYTDMVSSWLDRAHGDVSYRNAGVGGDFITRMWQRLQGEGAHRQEMYDDLFEPTPTRVFIWLGHNDSKLKPRAEYETPDDYPFNPVVPLDTFEETFVQVIEHIKANAPGAEITIISASSSVHEITRASVVKRIEERGNGGSYFGKPDVLEAFNERMQTVAEATDVGYLDAYEPTRTHPDKPSLFTADGVHMSHKGNLLMAQKMLEYLSE